MVLSSQATWSYNHRRNYKIVRSIKFYSLFFIFVCSTLLNAQNRELVWAEEFTGTTVDNSKWDFDIGPTNDNVHYYTDRTENVQIIDGVLHIIALEESYMGFNYTAGLIKTRTDWRYGRFEARIQVPATNGFVPAFWMLPADNIYGWWPNSGEIDIMEHPTNQVTTIYGTIHSEAYNLFGGSTPPGRTIEISDAETEFHLYVVEWTENQIDFYVDDQPYFSFSNDQGGSATWPFDKPFYIILNVAVGGGWVGNPDETTIFPATMKVDYVRVYQELQDMAIQGEDFVPYASSDISYSVPEMNGADYSWEVPGNAVIERGQNTHQIIIDWGYFGGTINADVTTENGSRTLDYPVKVSANLLKNSGFEKGVKYWNKGVSPLADATFSLNTQNALAGNYALSIDVQSLAANPWDIQVSQNELMLTSGEHYNLTFWAKSDNIDGEINLAIINSSTFFVYTIETFQLTSEWTQYEINYTATATAMVAINIDLGIQTGIYYFDDFHFSTPELLAVNQIQNPDFFEGDTDWNINTLSTAQATGTVFNGEYLVTITDGGSNVWDVHLGQSAIQIENGKEYVVTFDAYASDPRTISVLVGMNSEPWTVYHGSQILSLTTEKKIYSYSFIMSDQTDGQARFGFDIGASTIDVYFDNIMVSSGTISSGLKSDGSPVPKSIYLFQNYPNPFNPVTIINYELPITNEVELSIYNLLGQKVTTLVSDPQRAGHHQVEWDASGFASGVYYYQIEVGEFRDVKKMVLLR
jgi:beta-glucanase (GH16 family)